jgi:hypothetical protein
MSEAAVNLFVRSYVLQGKLEGPGLTDGRHSENKSPFNDDEVPVGGLYLADLGFLADVAAVSLSQTTRGRQTLFCEATAPRHRTLHALGSSHQLRGILPQEEGEAKEIGVLLGKQAKLPVRLRNGARVGGSRRAARPSHWRSGPGSGTPALRRRRVRGLAGPWWSPMCHVLGRGSPKPW